MAERVGAAGSRLHHPAWPVVVAEGCHQDFAKKNLRHPHIVRHDASKVAAFKRLFPELER